MTRADVLDRPLALLLVTEADGTALATGTVRTDGDGLAFEHARGRFPLPPDALGRIRRVDAPDARAVLGADLVLTLAVGDLPDDASGTAPTGLRWPG